MTIASSKNYSFQFSLADQEFRDWIYQGALASGKAQKDATGNLSISSQELLQQIETGIFNGAELSQRQVNLLSDLLSGNTLQFNSQGELVGGINENTSLPSSKKILQKASEFFEAIGRAGISGEGSNWGAAKNFFRARVLDIGTDEPRLEQLLRSIESPEEMQAFQQAVEAQFMAQGKSLDEIISEEVSGRLLGRVQGIIRANYRGEEYYLNQGYRVLGGNSQQMGNLFQVVKQLQESQKSEVGKAFRPDVARVFRPAASVRGAEAPAGLKTLATSDLKVLPTGNLKDLLTKEEQQVIETVKTAAQNLKNLALERLDNKSTRSLLKLTREQMEKASPLALAALKAAVNAEWDFRKFFEEAMAMQVEGFDPIDSQERKYVYDAQIKYLRAREHFRNLIQENKPISLQEIETLNQSIIDLLRQIDIFRNQEEGARDSLVSRFEAMEGATYTALGATLAIATGGAASGICAGILLGTTVGTSAQAVGMMAGDQWKGKKLTQDRAKEILEQSGKNAFASALGLGIGRGVGALGLQNEVLRTALVNETIGVANAGVYADGTFGVDDILMNGAFGMLSGKMNSVLGQNQILNKGWDMAQETMENMAQEQFGFEGGNVPVESAIQATGGAFAELGGMQGLRSSKIPDTRYQTPDIRPEDRDTRAPLTKDGRKDLSLGKQVLLGPMMLMMGAVGDGGPGIAFAPKRPGKTKPEETKPRVTKQAPALRGITQLEDLPIAFDIISSVHPRWKGMVDAMERLREERIQKGDVSKKTEEAFAIQVSDKGTYSARHGLQDRRTSLSDHISLQPGVSIFALIHELTHALPLDVLPPELASMPYQEMEYFEDSVKGSFEEIYFHLLNSVYQDEAISSLAEMLLYRDMKAVGFELNNYASDYEIQFFEENLHLLEEQGIIGYLKSEVYVGRNHRSNYNKSRILQLALLATFDPKILEDPSLHSVLMEQGVQVQGASALHKKLNQIQELLKDPSPTKIFQLIGELQQEGVKVDIDLATVLDRVKEFIALTSGKTKKASVSFLGRKEETIPQVQLLAEARHQFKRYQSEFEEAWKAAGGDLEKIEWNDMDGLLSLFRMGILLHQQADAAEAPKLKELLEQVKSLFAVKAKVKSYAQYEGGNDKSLSRFTEAVLDLEEVRLLGRESDVDEAMRRVITRLELFVGHTYQGKQAPNRNSVLPILTEALRDPWLRKLVTMKGIKKCFLRIRVDEYLQEQGFFYLFQREQSSGDISALASFVRALDLSRNDEARFLVEPFKKDNHSFWFFQNEALQTFYAHSDVLHKPTSQYSEVNFQAANSIVVFDAESRREAEIFKKEEGFDSSDLPKILQYQKQLHEIRSGRAVKISFKEMQFTDDLGLEPRRIPVFFWLGEGDTEIPESVPSFPQENLPIPKAVVVQQPENLPYLHLKLEQLERDPTQVKISEKIKREVFIEISSITGLLNDSRFLPNVDAGTVWVTIRLVIRWAELAAKRGDATWGFELLRQLSADFDAAAGLASGNLALTIKACRDSLEAAQRFHPVHSAKTETERREVLKSIIQEYETTVKLRRQGLSPQLIAEQVVKLGQDPVLRPEMVRLLELAIEHTAAFSPQVEEFRLGVKSLIAAIDKVHLVHHEKERLMTRLLEALLPKQQEGSALAALSTQRRLQVLQWFEGLLLTDETLDRLALYPAAEAILLQRSQAILNEIRAAQFPIQIQGKILQVALRLERFFHRIHPEIIDQENQDRLARVSQEPAYEEALADLFPSRRVLVDTTLPVAQWSPIMVRKGLPDAVAVWERIRGEIEEYLLDRNSPRPPLTLRGGENLEAGKQVPPLKVRGGQEGLLPVFEAFVLHQIEASGRPTNLVQEATGLFQKFQERAEEMKQGGLKTTASAALTLYSSANQILSQKEKLLLDQLTTLPAVAWGLKISERAFSEHRSLSQPESEIWQALLAAPTVSDALRKRELFVLVLSDERFPLELRRQAVLGLGHASQKVAILESILAGFAGSRDQEGEKQFYRMLVNYWQRIGGLPDDQGLLLLLEEKKQEAGFWRDFDRVLARQPNGGVTVLELELLVMQQPGDLAERFLDEAKRYLAAEYPERLSLVFKAEFEQLFPKSVAEREALRPVLEAVVSNRSARQERMEIIRLELPPAFVRQRPEIRFLLLNFLQKMPSQHSSSLIRELRELSESAGDAEIFHHFFLRTGLEKAGQFLSTMVGLIPDADREVFAKLQDDVPPSSPSEIRKTVESELGKPLREIFSEWDEIPVASASIGEVYRARLQADGSEVYVKVSPPTKRLQIEMAITTLLQVAKAFEANRGRFQTSFDIATELRTFVDQLKRQLDFTNELRQARVIGSGYATPEYLPALTKPHLLVMKPVVGTKVTTLIDPASRKQAAQVFVRQALRMLMIDGNYHADPHPGNVFWNHQEEKLTWLDWGVVGSINESEMEKVKGLLVAIMMKDTQGQQASLEAIASTSGYDQGQLSEVIRGLNQEADIATQLTQLLKAAGQQNLYVRPKIMRALAFLLTVHGVALQLDPEINFVSIAQEVYLEKFRAPSEEQPSVPVKKELSASEQETRQKLDEELKVAKQDFKIRQSYIPYQLWDDFEANLSTIGGDLKDPDTSVETIALQIKNLKDALFQHSPEYKERSKLWDKMIRGMELPKQKKDAIVSVIEKMNEHLGVEDKLGANTPAQLKRALQTLKDQKEKLLSSFSSDLLKKYLAALQK